MSELSDQLETWRQLRESRGLLEAAAAASTDSLHAQRELRRTYSPDLVRAACGLAELRRRAHGRFQHAERMWFDRKGLEQATTEPVARHKSLRFDAPVLDLCCGMGGDSLALSDRTDVVAVDRHPVACQQAVWNAVEYGNSVIPICANVEDVVLDRRLVHIDPDRRTASGRRVRRVEQCQPGLEWLRDVLVPRARGGAIKLSPASNFGGKFADVETELISLNGECKEATLWFGQLRGPHESRATVLPSGESIAGNPLDFRSAVSPLQAYLFDPDPAVVRAGLVDLLGERLDLNRLDDAEEYLTGSRSIASPFLRAFSVVEVLPRNEKAVRKYFRTANVGQLEVKCRHLRLDVESFLRKIPLNGSTTAVVFLARVEGRARFVVANRVD